MPSIPFQHLRSRRLFEAPDFRLSKHSQHVLKILVP